MKILLLGPNGQLGSDVRAVNASLARPHDILALDRAACDLGALDTAEKVIADIDFDVLLNASSYHKTDEVEGNAQQAFTINAHLVERLARLTARKQARLIHISTDYVFGGQTARQPLNEGQAKVPLNVYGASKAMGEDLALLAGDHVTVLRVASLFGVAGASGKGGNFVETMIRFGRERGALKVVSDQIMSPTATADIAAALFRMLDQDALGGIWHVVNAGAASWHAFAARIIERAGIAATVTPIPSSEFPTPARRPAYSVLDNAKLTAAIGPMRPWEDALDDYLVAKGYRA